MTRTTVLPDFPLNYDFDVYYSIATEYTGPALTSTIPRIVPIDVYEIPTADFAVDSSLIFQTLPIIQPIMKSDFNVKESSEVEVVSGTGNVSFGHYSNPVDSDSDSNGSDLSSPVLSSTDCIEEGEGHPHTRETADLDLDSDSDSDSDSVSIDDEENELIEIRRKARSVKKGLCHRCFKGNRFTEKEICIVCSAKYCSCCVLRAMGSMPEGRKCITCIGYPIDESNRLIIGKCTRMLKHLLSDFEVKQVMDFETSCEFNKVPPRLVWINGRPLRVDEMEVLERCKNPPKKLKPGRYWYDKVSGLWGKEGEKPSQIITAQLAIGNPIRREASNGKTNVVINNRIVTKAELWMLQSAGVNCEGRPHYWVSADGSYQEEGQNNVMGKIWDKAATKLVCKVLSLPFRSGSVNSDDEESENSDKKHVANEHRKHKELNKFLLVGYDQSGTSTIFKQAKILYNSPFSEDERHNVKSMIQSNMYGYLGILLSGRVRFEEECLAEMRQKRMNQPSTSANPNQTEEKTPYTISPRLKSFSDWLLQVMMTGNLDAVFPAATREYAPRVEELWRDNAFQATYSRRNELSTLPRVANYFLDRAVEICRADYEPSDMDILYADGITSFNGLSSMDFSFSKPHHFSFTGPVDQSAPLQRYQLIRVHSSSLGEKFKWSNMFEDVDLILYCVALTDYDELYYDNHGFATNKMVLARNLFENIISHAPFDNKNFLLILNKFDLLEEKIEHSPLSECEWFHDFAPVHSSSGVSALTQSASHYIGSKFKKLFDTVNLVRGRKLFVSVVTGLECDSVGEALSYGREIIIWDEERKDFSKEFSSASTEEITTTTSSS